MNKTILIVDDEEDLRDLFSQVIEAAGFNTLTAAGGHEALEIAKKNSIFAVLTDIRMPKGDGFELLLNLKKLFPQMPVFIMSGYNDFNSEELLNAGAAKIYSKPFNYDEFIQILLETE